MKEARSAVTKKHTSSSGDRPDHTKDDVDTAKYIYIYINAYMCTQSLTALTQKLLNLRHVKRTCNKLIQMHGFERSNN